MRTYGEFCSIAKALDVVGDRWTLLIVRELWIRGAARYTDLRNGLPGIATNLLSDRLRQLEQAGLIVSEEAPPPVATTLFSLTDRGRALEPVLDALGAWGKWELRKPAAEDEAFLTHWLTFPLSHRFEDAEPEGPPVVVELRTGDAPLLIELAGGELDVGSRRASDPDADVILTGDHRTVTNFLLGLINLEQATADGLDIDGDATVLGRLAVRRRPH